MKTAKALANNTCSIRPKLMIFVLLLSFSSCRPVTFPSPTATPVPLDVNITSLSTLGEGLIYHLAWSPDGTLLALASSQGIHFYDPQTLSQLLTIGDDVPVYEIAFSPDNKFLASIAADGLYFRQVETGDILRILDQRTDSATGLGFSPVKDRGDYFLAVGLFGGRIRLWRGETGMMVRSLPAFDLPVADLVFSPDGAWLVSSDQEGRMIVWSTADTYQVQEFGDLGLQISGLALTADGATLAAVSLDGRVQFWDMSDCTRGGSECGHSVGELEVPFGTVSALDFSPRDPVFALGAPDGAVQLWINLPGECEKSPFCWLPTGVNDGHQATVSQVAFSPDGTHLASRAENAQVRLWQMSGCELDEIASAKDTDTSSDGAVDELCSKVLVGELDGYTTVVHSAAVLPGEQTVLAGYADGRIRIWANPERAEYRESAPWWQAHHGAVVALQVSPDGKRVFSAGEDNIVRVWRYADGALLNEFRPHAWPVTSLAVSPDGAVLATSSCDNTVKLWRSDDAQPLGRLEHPGCVNGVAFSSSGDRLATAASDGQVRLWQLSDAQLLNVWSGHKGPVWSVAFDQEYLLSGGTDGTVRLWSPQSETAHSILRGAQGRITSVTMSLDGQLVLAGSEDQTVRVWQVEGRVLLYTLKQGGAVTTLDWVTRDQFAVGTDRGLVRLWQIE